jgi:hypothetical protein
LGREPRDEEFGLLQNFLELQRSRFAASDGEAQLLATGATNTEGSAGKTDLPGGASAKELAAWTALARVVLNLDETITKE